LLGAAEERLAALTQSVEHRGETSVPWFDITVVAISFAGIAALIAFLMLGGQ
jgi:hypothetical protein